VGTIDDETFEQIMALPFGDLDEQRPFDRLATGEQRAIWMALALALTTTIDTPFSESEQAALDAICAARGYAESRSQELMRPLIAHGILGMRDRAGVALIEAGRDYDEGRLTGALNLLATAMLPELGEAGDWYEDCWSAGRSALAASGYGDAHLERWIAAATEIALGN
jgi:hypothetical protein